MMDGDFQLIERREAMVLGVTKKKLLEGGFLGKLE